MNIFIIFLLLVVAFFLGFLIALHFVSNNKVKDPDNDNLEKNLQTNTASHPDESSEIEDEVVHEEQTRKVNRVEIEDLLHLDGDVIEAEPAPTVPLVHYERVSKELKILKQEIKAIKEKENNKDSGVYPVACDKDLSK